MSSSSRLVFDPKYVGETVVENFDFISKLASGETISGVPTVTATVWSGVDANPGNIVSGAASVAGTVVSQKLTAGVAGVLYLLKCTAGTSAGQTLILEALLFVAPDGP